MSNNKLKAFTLSEMLIVLVITSIVVATAFSVLRLVTKQLNAISKKYEMSTEVALLKKRLSIDFDRASSVEWDAVNGQLHMVIKDTLLTYEISDSKLIRDRDTLSLPITSMIYYYKGQEVETGITDGVQLEVMLSGNRMPIFISRRMAAQDIMDMYGNKDGKIKKTTGA